MFPGELFRVAVTVPSRGNHAVAYGGQWDNYPNDFNILKNRISLIINLPPPPPKKVIIKKTCF